MNVQYQDDPEALQKAIDAEAADSPFQRMKAKIPNGIRNNPVTRLLFMVSTGCQRAGIGMQSCWKCCCAVLQLGHMHLCCMAADAPVYVGVQNVNVDVHDVTRTDAHTMAVHAHAETFDPKVESLFRYLQVSRLFVQ
jgi:hypothetical protein